MDKFEKRILDYLSKPAYKPLRSSGLARKLKLAEATLVSYEAALEKLIATGKVHQGRDNKLRLKSGPHTVVGIIKRITSGAGYLIPHEPRPAGKTDDVYVAPQDMRDAHTGDEALVRLLDRRRSRGQRCGRIEEILVRATSVFVGTYCERDEQGYVQVDGGAFSKLIYVGDPGAKGAQIDDKVVIEMLRFPSHFQLGEAVITQVLGPRGKTGVDILSIVHEFGLPHDFPEEVLEAARQQSDKFDESDLGDRLDLTKETIVTIDPADARDFDDAISLSRSDDGHWHLGVHIADVSHFVVPKSPLDTQARSRGTSVYLPQHVIPMLPEVLSNGLASLQKGKVRFTKSVFIEFNPDGIPVSTEFANSAIKVTRRFAYEEVLPIIEDPERFRTRVSVKVRELLSRMRELAMILRRRRLKAGTLELDLREVKLDFDPKGRMVGAHEVESDFSHQIIEEFMLAANIAVATKLNDRGVNFLRRTHGDPDRNKLKRFAEFVTALGYRLKRFESRADLQSLIREVRGTEHEHAVNYALLRSLKPAEYNGLDIGHYALAVENYCHFTSPIRRYPDLHVHRLVDQLIRSRKTPKGPGELELAKLGKHCSTTERRAEQAERELTKVKLLTYMTERVGDEMDAVITGVETFGIFCQGIEIPVEGLIHISALEGDDFFSHDPSTFSLVGRRTGKQYQLGGRIRVVVAHVDVERRKLDFRVAQSKSRRRSPKVTSQKEKTNRKEKTKSPSKPASVHDKKPSGRKSKKKKPLKKSATKRRKRRRR